MSYIQDSKEEEKVWSITKKNVRLKPWEQLCVNLVGTCKIQINSSKKVWKTEISDALSCIIIID